MKKLMILFAFMALIVAVGNAQTVKTEESQMPNNVVNEDVQQEDVVQPKAAAKSNDGSKKADCDHAGGKAKDCCADKKAASGCGSKAKAGCCASKAKAAAKAKEEDL